MWKLETNLSKKWSSIQLLHMLCCENTRTRYVKYNERCITWQIYSHTLKFTRIQNRSMQQVSRVRTYSRSHPKVKILQGVGLDPICPNLPIRSKANVNKKGWYTPHLKVNLMLIIFYIFSYFCIPLNYQKILVFCFRRYRNRILA